MCKLNFDQTFLHKRNFSNRWISDADSLCTIEIHEYASSKQYAHTMSLLPKDHASFAGQRAVANAPIINEPDNTYL